MKAGEDSRSGGIEITGAPGDLRHQFIDFLGELNGIAGVTDSDNRINLVEDIDSNRLPGLVGGFHLFEPRRPLTGAEKVHLPKQFFDTALHMFALVAQMSEVVGQSPELRLRFGQLFAGVV